MSGKKMQMSLLALLSVCALFACSIAEADSCNSGEQEATSQKQCAALIEECFAHADPGRSECYYSASKHPFCEGSTLGMLAIKRWSMGPDRAHGEANPLALMGPRLVDRECLANFDSRWSAHLLENDYSEQTASQLSETLNGCARELSIELTRP